MTPVEFVDKWRGPQDERRSSQSHFLDLCRLLGEADPKTADPSGRAFVFEKGATKVGGGDGWADVWKRGHFGWEYKTTGKNLDEAYKQLQRYAPALENPPLLVVSDFADYRVHTHWTNRVTETHAFRHDDLLDAKVRAILKHAFTDPGALRPGKTRQQLTEEAAKKFAGLAQRLRERGYAAERVAHFVNRLVFCMFAEDVDLLPKKIFSDMLRASAADPASFGENASDLFGAMRSKGGRIGFTRIEWFNGGLFDDDDALPLEAADIREVLAAADLDWAEIDPSILGTLFERGLDPDKRSQLGAHYTDRDKIMLIVNPVIVEPLTREWEAARAEVEARVAKAAAAKSAGARTTAIAAAREPHRAFIERLRQFRVLDPACGSGNFLYLALRALKDLEHIANVEAARLLGETVQFPQVGPECVKGIEINLYAAELARVSVWIGEIQWMRSHGFDVAREPILKPLETIECRDALLNADGTRADWPAADVVIGNPPFLGDKLMLGRLGDDYVATLRNAHRNDVKGGADLVCYWIAHAFSLVQARQLVRVGLVATNSIRGGASRSVLDCVVDAGRIFNAHSDEAWTVDGAAVRVSMISLDAGGQTPVKLDGRVVTRILSDLTPDFDYDLTRAKRLSSNECAFIGDQKTGAFDIPGKIAREWIRSGGNPNARPNSDVLRPWSNGQDVTTRSSGRWIVDFGIDMSEASAALYDAPYRHLRTNVYGARIGIREIRTGTRWWLHQRPRPEMRRALARSARYIATPRVAKHRLFVWLPTEVLPDCQLVVIARDDDTTFGILHSRFHEFWSLRMCTWLGVGNDPRYTPSTTFETFPFPVGLTPNIPAADYAADPRAQRIAVAAARLNELRENWLNPPDLVRREPEVVPGYPNRILPVSDEAAAILKKRTLTNLYNERPAWLANAHRVLDEAVAAAYGWEDDLAAGRLADDEILARLFALNQERAKAGR